jgi:hypothetical protein
MISLLIFDIGRAGQEIGISSLDDLLIEHLAIGKVDVSRKPTNPAG